jgi:uncharacterized protein YecT (DUF1311 family)
MLRATLLSLVFMTPAVFADDGLERNCNPDYGLVDGSCLEQPEPERDLQDLYEWVWSRSGYEQRTLLERSQSAWLEYREATCDIMSARSDGISAGAHAKCFEFMARERAAELGLIRRVASLEEGCEGAP